MMPRVNEKDAEAEGRAGAAASAVSVPGEVGRLRARVRELESIMHRAIEPDMERSGLGLRLKYLSGGMSDEARTVDRYVLPERSGYYLGARMVEAAVSERGLAWAVRASATELAGVARAAATA